MYLQQYVVYTFYGECSMRKIKYLMINVGAVCP